MAGITSTTVSCIGLFLALQLWIVSSGGAVTPDGGTCYPALFSFGDSLADTGNQVAAFPATTNSENLPYGITFFNASSTRNSDGRLVIDFLAHGLNLPFLSPYLESVKSNFEHGVNFAAAGAVAVTPAGFAFTPFNLPVQVNQFKAFKKKVTEAAFVPGVQYPSLDAAAFDRALYVVSIGGNDFKDKLVEGSTFGELFEYLPTVLRNVVAAVEALYQTGARNFLVQNIPAQGCCTFFLANFPGGPEDYDELGCLAPLNAVVKAYNSLLHEAVQSLRRTLPEATIIYADYFEVNVDIMRDPGKYGIKNTFDACCGRGGLYNFDSGFICGSTRYENGVQVQTPVCSNPSEYVNWDGIHFTEAFYSIVGKAFLAGQYLEPSLPLQGCTQLSASS